MRDIFKNIFANVLIRDDLRKVLLNQSNLFVETGRGFVRDLLAGDITLDNTKYVVEFGASTQVPAQSDTDLITPLSPVALTNTYVISDVGVTEIDFAFDYQNSTGGDVTFAEIGLFYRPVDYDPGPGRVNAGTMLARLKSTYTSITIGDGRTISLTWKIIF
jgi:hypothetical protein